MDTSVAPLVAGGIGSNFEELKRQEEEAQRRKQEEMMRIQ